MNRETFETTLGSCFLIQLLAPNLILIFAFIFAGSLAFPFSDPKCAFEVFPKLIVEFATLQKVFSDEVAVRYVLAFVNGFFMNLLVFFVCLAKIVLTSISAPHSENIVLPDDKNGENTNFAAGRSWHLAKGVLFVTILAYFILRVPLAYTPANGSSHERAIYALYSFIAGAFPILFVMVDLLILAALRRFSYIRS